MALSVLCSLLAAFVAVGGASDVAEALPSLPSSSRSFSMENATEELAEKANGPGPTWAQCKSSCRSYCLRYGFSQWVMSYQSPGRGQCNCGRFRTIKSTDCIKDYDCASYEHCDMDLDKCVVLYSKGEMLPKPQEYTRCNQYKSGALDPASPENATQDLPLHTANATEEFPLDKAASERGDTWASCRSSCRTFCKNVYSYAFGLMTYLSPGRGQCYCGQKKWVKTKSCIKDYDCTGSFEHCDMELSKCVALYSSFKADEYSGCGQMKSGALDAASPENAEELPLDKAASAEDKTSCDSNDQCRRVCGSKGFQSFIVSYNSRNGWRECYCGSKRLTFANSQCTQSTYCQSRYGSGTYCNLSRCIRLYDSKYAGTVVCAKSTRSNEVTNETAILFP